MQRHKLNFRNKNHLEQLSISENLLTSLTAQPVERLQYVYLEDFQAATIAARASHERVLTLRSELKAAMSQRKTAFAKMRTATSRAATGATMGANYQPSEMLAMGLHLEAPKTAPVGLPPAPDHFRGEPTDTEGEAKLRWKQPLRRCSYQIAMQPDPLHPDHWQLTDTFSQQSGVIKGLISGQKYWFRVNAINAHGKSAWSQPIAVRVK